MICVYEIATNKVDDNGNNVCPVTDVLKGKKFDLGVFCGNCPYRLKAIKE